MKQRLAQLDRRLLTILLIVFVQMLGASLILPILPLYAQETFALSPQSVTLLISSFFAAQMLAGPTIGRLSDRYGRVPVLIVSQIGTAISFVLIALAQTPELLFFARIFDGITGGNIIVAQAYITDITPAEKRTQSLGLIFAAFGLGFIFGPALGGSLSALLGPQAPFLVAAVAAGLLVLLTRATLNESLTQEQRTLNRTGRGEPLDFHTIWSNSPLLMVLLIAFVGQFGLGLLQATFALYGKEVLFASSDPRLTKLGIGILLTFVGVGQFLTQTVWLPRALRFLGEPALAMLGMGLRALGFIVYALTTQPWVAAIGSLLFATGMGFLMPPVQALATRLVADSQRGRVLGLFQSVVSLAIIISTAVAGGIFAANPVLPHWLGAGLTLSLLLPGLRLWRQTTPRPAAAIPAATD